MSHVAPGRCVVAASGPTRLEGAVGAVRFQERRGQGHGQRGRAVDEYNRIHHIENIHMNT